MTAPKDWTDREILYVLDMLDLGFSMAEIGVKIGRTKNAVIGMVNRVRNLTDASDPDRNKNGTMPVRWWAKRRETT